MILVSAIELSREIAKPGDEPIHISHFMRSAQEKMRRKIILNWASPQLKEAHLPLEELEKRFEEQFCEEHPKILVLSGVGYRPESSEDLARHLDKLVREKKLVLSGGKYMIP